MDEAMMELLQEPAGRPLQTGELNMQDMMTEEKMQVSTWLVCHGSSCCNWGHVTMKVQEGSGQHLLSCGDSPVL